MPSRIAISGSAGTGKTTLARALADKLQVPYLEEEFRRRREAGLDPHDLNREEHRALIMELYDEALADARTPEKGFVQDRCPLDFLAFWLHYGFWGEETKSEQLFERVRDDLDHYDQIIVLPWGAIDISADGIRATNRWLQLKYQSLFEGLAHRLAPAGMLLWVPTDVTVLEDRLTFVVNSFASD